MKPNLLTDAELKCEIKKCEYCETKPCVTACPAGCSPFDFIMAIKAGEPQDYKRAAVMILEKNPLGSFAALACGSRHCVKSCIRSKIDHPVNISAIHATIIEKAKKLNLMPAFSQYADINKKIAIIGAGPSGLTSAFTLSKLGYHIDLFDNLKSVGGSARLIPDFRIPKEMIDVDTSFLLSSSKKNINLHSCENINDIDKFITGEYSAVILSGGLSESIKLGIKNEEYAVDFATYLENPTAFNYKGRVGVVGGGATALDCAFSAKKHGAKEVTIFALENIYEMVVPEEEINWLQDEGIGLQSRVKVSSINLSNDKISSIVINDVELLGEKFDLSKICDVEGSKRIREIDHLIIAVGARKKEFDINDSKVFCTGDYINGPTSVAETVADGKECAIEVHRFLTQNYLQYERTKINGKIRSEVKIFGLKSVPVSLASDFFGQRIESPFLLSASPLTDGFDQLDRAYTAGWAGAIMKTAFDNIPIHIPSEYMYAVNENTYGNCDNVSGHSLDRVCDEIKRIIKKHPNKLTMASTGGSVSGNDTSDKKSWQSNTLKLESAGAMGIEYSLSCPQGGDGTEGDIVSQNATLTAKIIDWVMQISDPSIPKLFKLTAQVTSIESIINAIKKVFDKYPNKKAGITLANTFPVLDFRKISINKKWDDGIVIGMSGEGVVPISYLTLAKVSNLGIHISGNGGPMNYKEAANFLALGAKTVQFCTIATKYGYGIINELHSGLSYLLEYHGLKSVKDLIGIVLPNPILDFMSLPSVKKISRVNSETCVACGNCTRCPYLAITLDGERHPLTDPSKCIGCSICSQKCISGALYMKERTQEELNLLRED